MSTATTTVLSILLLLTRPTFVRLGLRVSGITHQLPLPLNRFCAGDVLAHGSNARGVGELTRRKLKTQLEQLFAELQQPRLGVGHPIGGLLRLRLLAASRWFGATRARLPRFPLRHFRGPPSS